MCMVAAAVTKEFGVMATDSASYDIEENRSLFETRKLHGTVNAKYLVSYIGTPLYMANLDYSKFQLSLDSLSMYLSEYLKKMKSKVHKTMNSEIGLKDDREPNICLFVMGMHKRIPTLAQFNVFKNFEPVYTWTKEPGIKFSSIHYGGLIPGKDEVFKESTAYMQKKANRYELLTPGLVGEILTRGIYKKADLEEKVGEKKKFAGGVVNVGLINARGVFGLSGVETLRVQ